MNRFCPQLASLEARSLMATLAVSPPSVTAHVASTGRSTASQEVSAILADVVQKYGVPGMTGAVISGNKVIIGAAGVREAGTQSPVLATDLFHNGSTTKAMTAALAGVFVDRGLIHWNTTIGQVFPELRGQVRPEYLNVTLKDLLQQRGGIIADADATPALIQEFNSLAAGNPTTGRMAILKDLLNQPLPNPVGTFHYSNSGYAVVGTMLERLTGQSYETLMQRYVFHPLGMTTATFTSAPASPSAVPTGPVGHLPDGTPVPDGSPIYQLLDNPLTNPAGTNLRMSIADWSKFIRFELGETVHGTRLVSRATLAQLQTPAPGTLANGAPFFSGYASGFGTFPAGFGGRKAILGPGLWHNGSDNLWLAVVEAYPGKRFAVLLMANAKSGANGTNFETTAFVEARQRLIDAFAPKMSSK